MAIHFDIFPMESTHTEKIAELESICFGKNAWSKKSLDAELTKDTSQFFTALSESGEVLGYCGSYICIDECYINNIAVFPEFQGSGIGKALTQKLIQNAKNKNCVFITLEVRVSNQKAVSLYETLGFSTAGRRKNFYTSPIEDALIMTHYFKGYCPV